jgi:predicted nucleotidyltransferase
MKPTTAVDPQTLRNFGSIADDNEILRVLVGSGVHGIAIEGTDDRDEMGVFIEPPEHVLGVGYPMNTLTHRTQPEGHRSGPGDLDLVRYSLRHYARLLVKGNPNVLLPLFAPQDAVLISSDAGDSLRKARHIFLSQRAVRQTLGYMNAQIERMVDKRKLPNRPELIEKYGYDVKYASHAVRLAIQGYELALSGVLILPMRDHFRELVLAVKTGQYSQDQVVEMVEEYGRKIGELLRSGRCQLPPEPDYEAMNAFLIRAHESYWGMKGYRP